MKRITVINKSRKKDVKVNVIPSDAKDSLPTPPEDYKAGEPTEEDVWNEPFVDDEGILDDVNDVFIEDHKDESFEKETKAKTENRKRLAEELAKLDKKEMRNVIRAANHLRKFVNCIKDEFEDLQDAIDGMWRED